MISLKERGNQVNLQAVVKVTVRMTQKDTVEIASFLGSDGSKAQLSHPTLGK